MRNDWQKEIILLVFITYSGEDYCPLSNQLSESEGYEIYYIIFFLIFFFICIYIFDIYIPNIYEGHDGFKYRQTNVTERSCSFQVYAR